MNRILCRTTLLVVALCFLSTTASLGSADFVVWPAYNVMFDADTNKIYFLAGVYVQNLTTSDLRDLTLRVAPPEGFTVTPPPGEIHEAMRRAEGFSEEIVDGSYAMKQRFLGGAQATTMFYELHFTGRPSVVEFPGVEIEYRVGEEIKKYQAFAEAHDLAQYSRFSGNISDYIRRYAGFGLNLNPKKQAPLDWAFSALDYRFSGTNPMGIIEVEGTPDSAGSFRMQAGFPGDFREILVRWMPRKRGRKDPVTQELAAKELKKSIQALGDFAVAPESLTWSEETLARVPAVVANGRWMDKKKARLGSGPFRMYLLNDPRSQRDLVIYYGAQARGIGPENADRPAPEKEAELMKELESFIATLRL